MKTLDFYKVLKKGLQDLLSGSPEGDCYLNNYSKLEEAIGLGVLSFKEALCKEDYHLEIIELIRERFPVNYLSIDRFTGTVTADLTNSYSQPGKLGCVELHVFLNNTIDAYNVLILNLDSVIFEAGLEGYANIEVMGSKDFRICSAQLNFYGENSSSSALIAAGYLDSLLTGYEGYKLSVIYGRETGFNCCAISNKFQRKKEQVFASLWLFLRARDKLLTSEFVAEYDNLIAEYKKEMRGDNEQLNSLLKEES